MTGVMLRSPKIQSARARFTARQGLDSTRFNWACSPSAYNLRLCRRQSIVRCDHAF